MTATETKSADSSLPHWDMSVVFPSLEAPEFEGAFEDVIRQIAELKNLYDKHGVRQLDESPPSGEAAASFDEVVTSTNALREKLREIGSFIGAFVSTDSRNDAAQAKDSELDIHMVEMGKLAKRFAAWIGSLDVDGLIANSSIAKDHEFAVRKAKRAAERQMSEAEEDLASGLSVTGGNAWAKLHQNVSSQLSAKVEQADGSVKELPMSEVRGLAHDPDPRVREAAHRGELEGWGSVSVPMAAALNSIKGEDNLLNARRGWKDSLEPALFYNNVDRETVQAMQEACVESFPDFRRYLKAKAKLLGKETMAFWDLFAPVGGEGGLKRWSFNEAREFILEHFRTYSDKMAGLASRAFEERWIDAEPRLGKSHGAFCMGVRKDESRILSNYEHSFDSVQTLAHELGHAYHNLCIAHRTPMQRSTPMALAETASIFCQTIINQAALADASDAEKIAIVEGELQDACQVVVDIHSRFVFEKGVYEGRERRELSVDELNQLMLEAQKQTYGDGLDERELHQYMWAVKGHYYGATYYNWPYTFGLLFGLGIYQQYREDPDKFRNNYDDLLASTGMFDAANLCGRFGIDIRTPDFWRASLDIIRGRVGEFEELVAAAPVP